MKRTLAKVPTLQYIGRDGDTDKLYRQEQAVTGAIKRAAKTLGEYAGNDESEFWTDSLPCELYSVLETFQTDSSAAAATGFLIHLSLQRPEIFAHYWGILQAGAQLPGTSPTPA